MIGPWDGGGGGEGGGRGELERSPWRRQNPRRLPLVRSVGSVDWFESDSGWVFRSFFEENVFRFSLNLGFHSKLIFLSSRLYIGKRIFYNIISKILY